MDHSPDLTLVSVDREKIFSFFSSSSSLALLDSFFASRKFNDFIICFVFVVVSLDKLEPLMPLDNFVLWGLSPDQLLIIRTHDQSYRFNHHCFCVRKTET